MSINDINCQLCDCFGFSTAAAVGASADDLEVHRKKQTSAEYKVHTVVQGLPHQLSKNT